MNPTGAGVVSAMSFVGAARQKGDVGLEAQDTDTTGDVFKINVRHSYVLKSVRNAVVSETEMLC